MIYYETEYTVHGVMKVYRTKKLTAHHRFLRESFKPSRTLKCDTSVKWPFGCYAEVIEKEN